MFNFSAKPGSGVEAGSGVKASGAEASGAEASGAEASGAEASGVEASGVVSYLYITDTFLKSVFFENTFKQRVLVHQRIRGFGKVFRRRELNLAFRTINYRWERKMSILPWCGGED